MPPHPTPWLQTLRKLGAPSLEGSNLRLFSTIEPGGGGGSSRYRMPRLRLQSVAYEKLKFGKPNKAFSTTVKYRNCDRPHSDTP